MNSSARRAQIAGSGSAPLPGIHPFPYDSIPPGAISSGYGSSTLGEAGMVTANAAEQARREAQVRALGRQEGQAEAAKQFEERLAGERAGIASALAAFTRDRAAYFQQVEGEVVQLALSIARKILHREAQLDPLLLAGMVRVALEKIDGASGVVLRLHPQNAADWRRYLNMHLDPADVPEMVEDPAMAADRCRLETAMGTTTMGLEVQLKEIEQGLMDLLSARPGEHKSRPGEPK